jgi:NRAMP (natural resistance-associated macrophage protein)-like metal ion transporter
MELTCETDADGLMRDSSNDIAGNRESQAPDIPEDLPPWKPSGSFWKDAWFFVGPGWLVSIAYIDPGNYQADIQAGATTRYYLLFAVWWSSLLSIYVQILCVRLAYYSQLTLAETQARDCQSSWRRYVSWFLAEFSTMITDLPEVIGIGIACHLFFGWDYYVGVLLSLVTTMFFLATLNNGVQILE